MIQLPASGKWNQTLEPVDTEENEVKTSNKGSADLDDISYTIIDTKYESIVWPLSVVDGGISGKRRRISGGRRRRNQWKTTCSKAIPTRVVGHFEILQELTV
ncbi:hypothetical protein CDAR_468751 [Caerostris darwini]|uniref:Uncharacterized protein n=1 Tax=Caerostris darwini TaxID=1538125 RepID=A0AAV4T5V4_9ARAC|nr:hypothetical protein CDAR_468751 [Caerostris darwini]